MGYFEELKQILLPIPNNNIIDEDIEKYNIFPDDYIKFIQVYGIGVIDDFLWFLSPLTNNPNLNIFAKTKEILNTFNSKDYKNVSDYTTLLSTYNSLLIAVSKNGDYIFYTTDEGEERIIVIDDRFSEAEMYNMSFSEFLVKLLTTKIQSKILPNDFFEQKIFTPFIE